MSDLDLLIWIYAVCLVIHVKSLEFFVHSDGCLYFQCHICKKQDCPVRQHSFKGSIDWTLDNALQNEKHGLKNIEQ